ncbi:unnamed protein product [Symbiodinium sp. CCMP2592]|nr:unnamed protein product [Symbiodinium sp. CCMP2592]
MKSGTLAIQNLSTSQGSHLKLVNSGLAPYLTHSDWTALTTYRTQADQLQVLGQEACKGQAVAIMLMVQSGQGKPCLSPDSINSAVADFAVVLQALPATACPGAATYPANPNEMGEVWLGKAYLTEKPLGQEPCMAPWLKKALGLHEEQCFAATCLMLLVVCFYKQPYLQSKLPLRNTHGSLAVNNTTRYIGKRSPATPQAAMTFEEELAMLKLKHSQQPQSPAPLHFNPTKRVAAAPCNQVLPWLPPAPSPSTAAVEAEETKPPPETAATEISATEPAENKQSPKQDSFTLQI